MIITLVEAIKNLNTKNKKIIKKRKQKDLFIKNLLTIILKK